MTQTYIQANFDEAKQSQLPFVELLINMGWKYLPNAELEKARDYDQSKHILKNIAEDVLSKINSFEFGGKIHEFSPKNVSNAVYDLENVQFQGLITTSQEIYADFIGGRDFKEFIDGRDESFHFKYFDFEHIENNVFHVAVEVSSKGADTIRPDIILYVNGIPMVVVENKKSAVEINEAISQLIYYQKKEKCPKLFLFPQLLISANKESFLYGTTGTPAKFYSVWKEKDVDEAKLYQLMQTKIDETIYSQILNDLNGATIGHKQTLSSRLISEQDKGVFCMLSPKTLMNIVKNFILYDGAYKKVARHQQVRAVNKTLDTIQNIAQGSRKGGLVWHTQGSGKSLTMVMLAKAIFSNPAIENPLVIVVTDRKDLDRQIKKVFDDCKIKRNVVQAKSGSDLLEKIKENKSQVITTLVYKFDTAFKRHSGYVNESKDIFVLIDEAHRSQTGEANTNMQKIIPNACIIAFTGTPLMKGEHISHLKYGGYIDKYTIDDAVADENVLPLIYERRFGQIEQLKELIKERIDEDREIKTLTDEQKKKLQRDIKVRAILELDRVVNALGANIADHFKKNAFMIESGEPNGFKGQIVTASKYSALLFHEYFKRHTDIETAVIVSDENIKNEDDAPEHKKKVAEFIKEKEHAFGNLEKYEKACIDSFNNNEDGLQIIIVVDKLLTGFDAPRNSFLYLIKPLQDHNLLQAIARVNRLCEDAREPKTAGFIIDYSYNAENIKSAMDLFAKYEEVDVQRALVDVNDKIIDIEKVFDDVMDIFADVANKEDDEALVDCLADEEARKDFYKKINAFTKLFAECRVLKDFDEKFGRRKVEHYKHQLNKFLNIKKSANNRYADKIDLEYYREKIFKVLDVAIDLNPENLKQLVKPINIQDMVSIDENTKNLSKKSAAETIAYQARREVTGNMEKDPAYYKSFYERIQQLLDKIKSGDFKDEYLTEAKSIANDLFAKKDIADEIMPEDEFSQIIYRNLKTYFEKFNLNATDYSEIISDLVDNFKSFLIVDWTRNKETQRIIKNQLDDYIYLEIIQKKELDLLPHIDEMVVNVLTLAINNQELLDVK